MKSAVRALAVIGLVLTAVLLLAGTLAHSALPKSMWVVNNAVQFVMSVVTCWKVALLWFACDLKPVAGEEARTYMAEEIRAEMVANVMNVSVAEGDAVSDGDSLVMLESMKMEIPVLTELTGKVSQLAVRAGDVVQEGDLIAVVE